MERCDYSDLLEENCGHCRTQTNPGAVNAAPHGGEGRPTTRSPVLGEAVPAAPGSPVRIEGTWTTARYAGTCGCGCDGRIREGDDIVQARREYDDGASGVWALLDHARAAT